MVIVSAAVASLAAGNALCLYRCLFARCREDGRIKKKPFVCRVASQTDLQRSGNIMRGSWRQRMIYRPRRSELPVVFLNILSSICVTLRSVKIFNNRMPQQVWVSTLLRPWCCRPSGVRSAKKSCGREIQGNAASQCSDERRTLGTFALLALLAFLHSRSRWSHQMVRPTKDRTFRSEPLSFTPFCSRDLHSWIAFQSTKLQDWFWNLNPTLLIRFEFALVVRQEWFRRGTQTSPLTNLPLDSKEFLPNLALRQVLLRDVSILDVDENVWKHHEHGHQLEGSGRFSHQSVSGAAGGRNGLTSSFNRLCLRMSFCFYSVLTGRNLRIASAWNREWRCGAEWQNGSSLPCK